MMFLKEIAKHLLHWFCSDSFLLNKINNFEGIVLTFDDGPHFKNTPIILRELGQRNIKAIFFVSGCELVKYPELGKMILDQGHLLGNHTYDHFNIHKCSFERYVKSIEKADNCISDLHLKTKYTPLFRPPYSSFSLRLILYIYFSKYTLMNWTIDSRDSYIFEEKALVAYLRNLDIRKGDILLFHEDCAQTVVVLPEILDYLLEQGHLFKLPRICKKM